jgi:hypothetical protein
MQRAPERLDPGRAVPPEHQINRGPGGRRSYFCEEPHRPRNEVIRAHPSPLTGPGARQQAGSREVGVGEETVCQPNSRRGARGCVRNEGADLDHFLKLDECRFVR